MPTPEEWEEMIRQTAFTQAGQRSRFYGRDDSSHQQQSHTFRPPPASYELRPVPVPGISIDNQLRALQVLRAQMRDALQGQRVYFAGDRINLPHLGLPQEPPILAGRFVQITEVRMALKDPLHPYALFAIEQVAGLIDCAYFSHNPPVLQYT